MPHHVNRQWRLARHARLGDAPSHSFFEFTESPIPDPGSNEVLIRTIALGTSPAQFGYMIDGEGMFSPMKVGDVMRGRGVGEVIASHHPDSAVGDVVTASLGWQDFSFQDPTKEPENIKTIFKVARPLRPLTTALGTFGVDAFAAYFGLLEIGRPKPGETVLVSAAAGGIGSIVGQIAKIHGCRVVGISGSDEKCAWLTDELGFDAAINYRAHSVKDGLRVHCPDGIDIFFDSVGGEILNTALDNLAMHARVVICGWISTQYKSAELAPGPAHYIRLLRFRARMEGFVVFDFAARFDEAEIQLQDWAAAGRLTPTEELDERL